MGRLTGRRASAGIAIVVAVAVGLLSAAAFGQTPSDPLSVARWSITIDGVEIATFSELGGIVSELEAAEFVDPGGLSKLAFVAKPPMVVLKRGMTNSMELWAWHEAARSGQIATARRSAVLTGFDTTGAPVVKFFLANAVPLKLEVTAGADTAKKGQTPLLETVTLTAEHMQRVAP